MYVRADDVEAEGFNIFRKILGKERENATFVSGCFFKKNVQ